MHRPSRRSVLTNEPGVFVTIGKEEEVQLKPMNPHEGPKKRKSFREIETILSGTSDVSTWNNLLPFFQGMHMSKYPVHRDFPEHLAKRAGEQGRVGVMLKLAEMSESTGVSLSNPFFTRELMLACHRRAAAAGFKGAEFMAAARTARSVASLLEKKDHCGGKLKENDVDMRRSLSVVGVLLEIDAAEAINNGAVDKDGRVNRFLSKAIALSDQSLWDTWLQKEASPRAARPSHLGIKARSLECMLPLLRGMRMASKIQGVPSGELKSVYETRIAALQATVDKTREEVNSDLREVAKKNEEAGKPPAGKSMRAIQMQEQLDAVQL